MRRQPRLRHAPQQMIHRCAGDLIGGGGGRHGRLHATQRRDRDHCRIICSPLFRFVQSLRVLLRG